MDDVDSAQEEEIAMLHERLNTVSTKIANLEVQVFDLKNSTETKIINGDVTVNNLVINENGSMNILNANDLNNKDLHSFLQNVMLIDEDVNVKEMLIFEELSINNLMSVNSINNISMDTIVRKNDNINVQAVEIDGQAIFDANLKVDGHLNGIKFTNDDIVLYSGSQDLKTNLSANNLNVENLIARNSDFLSTTSANNNPNNEIKAKKIYVNGLINNANITQIFATSLKTHGDQDINTEYVFDHVKTNDLNTTSLAGKQIPNDLIFITGTKQELNNDVHFDNDVNMNNVIVANRLNNIEIRDGKLDILLSNSTKPQYIDGYKLFENVELTDRIKYRGKIDKKIQELFGPVSTYDDTITVNGDRTIVGSVTIENRCDANDLNANDTNYSARRLNEHGLKLTENIPTRLTFKQQQHVRYY